MSQNGGSYLLVDIPKLGLQQVDGIKLMRIVIAKTAAVYDLKKPSLITDGSPMGNVREVRRMAQYIIEYLCYIPSGNRLLALGYADKESMLSDFKHIVQVIQYDDKLKARATRILEGVQWAMTPIVSASTV